MYIVSRILKQLRRDGYENEAGILQVVARGGLLLNQRKADAGYQRNPVCPLCKADVEDEEHIFWKCPVAKAMDCPEVKKTNHYAAQALQETDKKAKWLRGLQLADETLGVLKQWEDKEEYVQATANLLHSRLQIPEGCCAGTDASGGKYTGDWRLRR
eukprot:10595275-Karenia_brevis.AAC.1